LTYAEHYCEICGKKLYEDDYCRIVLCGTIRKVYCQEHFEECFALIERWEEDAKLTEYTLNQGAIKAEINKRDYGS
jgi:hypothetical protein